MKLWCNKHNSPANTFLSFCDFIVKRNKVRLQEDGTPVLTVKEVEDITMCDIRYIAEVSS